MKERIAGFEERSRMSVIGRLDEQVDEVLIEPLQRKNKQEANEQEDEHVPSRVQTESESIVKKRAESDALPVWLL
jgi:hypothetical protein